MTERREPRSQGPRSPAARVLGAGARGAERLAEATGVDKAVEDAMEEAIVRALRSPAVERAIVRVIQENSVQDAVAEALTQEEIAEAIIRAIDSEAADQVWADLLASDKVQMLVERIAEAPEVRAAITQQGVGFITDIGHRITIIAGAIDDALERIARRVPRPEGELGEKNVGLVTRAIGAAIDIGVISVILSLASSLLRWVIPSAGAGDGVSTIAVLGLSGAALMIGGGYFVTFWGLVGQTLGMRFLGIRIDAEGRRELGLRRATRRLLMVPVALLPFALGFLTILTSPQRRSWPDRFAGTTVVYEKRRMAAPWSVKPEEPA